MAKQSKGLGSGPAPKQRGMGRGLAAILQADSSENKELELRTLPIDLVSPNPDQPRREFSEEGLQALADSIADRGVLQPILVRPLAGGRYEIVAGERRWRASALAGLEEIPALSQERDDATALQAALVENMARIDLNPVEEARAVSALVEDMGLTRDAVGKMVGRSRVAISNLLRILDLPDEVLDLVGEGTLSEGHARAILTAADHSDRKRLARDAAAGGWSVRVLEQKARAATGDSKTSAKPSAPSDQIAAAEELSEEFARLLAREVKVVPSGAGFAIKLKLDSHEDALALARRLRG